jgi:hypothetical protein
MIEYMTGLWRFAPALGFAIVVIVVVYGVVRAVRSRKPAAPTRMLPPPMSPDDPANLDSSHIRGPITKGGGL